MLFRSEAHARLQASEEHAVARGVVDGAPLPAIYVWLGTARPRWRPTPGGAPGELALGRDEKRAVNIRQRVLARRGPQRGLPVRGAARAQYSTRSHPF